VWFPTVGLLLGGILAGADVLLRLLGLNAIVRDPRVGSFGVIGFASILVLKVAAVGALSLNRPLALVLAPVLGRWAIVLLAAAFPPGRTSGLGAPVKAAASPKLLALASALPLALSVAMGATGLWLLSGAGVTALLIGWWLCRLVPGLTGDCYGAACECVETSVLLLAGALAIS
jgi:adenosylcobinamide-GDP ribazoletransferase